MLYMLHDGKFEAFAVVNLQGYIKSAPVPSLANLMSYKTVYIPFVNLKIHR